MTGDARCSGGSREQRTTKDFHNISYMTIYKLYWAVLLMRLYF